MDRYQIVYCKTQPLITWESTEAAAWAKAATLKRYGYRCHVWRIRPDGSGIKLGEEQHHG